MGRAIAPVPFASTAYYLTEAVKLGGSDKLKAAVLPQIAAEVERVCGRQVVNEEALTEALAHLAQFFVMIEKAVGVKPS